MANVVRKGVFPQVFGRSRQLSLNKFFDSSTHYEKSRRRREKTGGGEIKTKIVTFILATNVDASQLPELPLTGTSTARANCSQSHDHLAYGFSF